VNVASGLFVERCDLGCGEYDRGDVVRVEGRQ